MFEKKHICHNCGNESPMDSKKESCEVCGITLVRGTLLEEIKGLKDVSPKQERPFSKENINRIYNEALNKVIDTFFKIQPEFRCVYFINPNTTQDQIDQIKKELSEGEEGDKPLFLYNIHPNIFMNQLPDELIYYPHDIVKQLVEDIERKKKIIEELKK